ncbi:VQ motif-containing protein 25 [Linum grandiflorum]
MKKNPNNNHSSPAAQSSSSSSSAVPSHSSSPSPALSFHKHSRRPITKPPPSPHPVPNNSNKNPPKIRIIHIFAPEIIKTDVANFRELVQRLTGKPTPHVKSKRNNFPPSNITESSYDVTRISDQTNYVHQQRRDYDVVTKATSTDFSSYSDEINSGLLCDSSGFEFKEMGSNNYATMVKEEGDYDENRMAWVNNNDINGDGVCGISDGKSSGYFEEIDGFIQELGADQFQLMEQNRYYGSHHQLHLHGFGEAAHQFA